MIIGNSEIVLKNSRSIQNEIIIFIIATPAILLITLLMIVPIAWLIWLSVISNEGYVSFENYYRLFDVYYGSILIRTLLISTIVTIFAALFGYTLAYYMIDLSENWLKIVLVCVLLPFWTSLLVRTYAWLVLLQRRGILNTWLQAAGITSEPLPLMHNLTGAIIGMLHIMLPFLILPVYAAMRSIDPNLRRAAASCGATPTYSFWTVFFPLSRPGLIAGSALVFVLCLGFYVTPAVLGGGRVTMWAMQIETEVMLQANWGAASALGVVLLAVTFALLALAYRVATSGQNQGREA